MTEHVQVLTTQNSPCITSYQLPSVKCPRVEWFYDPHSYISLLLAKILITDQILWHITFKNYNILMNIFFNGVNN